jgi:DTW domain-containing protein YfiP
MRQTAVEWLIQKLINRQNGIIDEFPVLSLDELFEQAKQMEKEQHEYTAINIAEFVLDKIDGESNLSAKEAFEQYYKTYGGKP